MTVETTADQFRELREASQSPQAEETIMRRVLTKLAVMVQSMTDQEFLELAHEGRFTQKFPELEELLSRDLPHLRRDGSTAPRRSLVPDNDEFERSLRGD